MEDPDWEETIMYVANVDVIVCNIPQVDRIQILLTRSGVYS